MLWPLARALNGSSAFYASQWERRQRLQGKPTLILWGMKDTAFRPHMLGRWKEALPDAKVVELADAGHWPHEESPEAVLREMSSFLAESPLAQGGYRVATRGSQTTPDRGMM